MNFDDPKDLGLLQFALGLMKAGGASRMPVTLGDAFGTAGIHALDAMDKQKVLKQRDEELRRRNALVDMQMKALTEKLGQQAKWRSFLQTYDPTETITRTPPSSPGDYAPGEAPNVSVTQTKQSMPLDLLRNAPDDISDDLVRAMFVNGKGGNSPKDVQTALWYLNASPEEKRAFQIANRAAKDAGGVPYYLDENGKPVWLIPPDAVASNVGQQRYAGQYGSNAADAQQRMQPVTMPDGSLGYRSQDQIRGGPAPYSNPFEFGGARLPSAGPQPPPPEVEAEVTRRAAAIQRAAESGQTGPISFGNVNSGSSAVWPGIAKISRQELNIPIRPPEEAGPRLAGEKKAKELEAQSAADKKKELGTLAKLRAGVDTAERLLKMDPTSSDIGWAVDRGLQVFGISVPSSDAATALETVAGWMTSTVPRLEGPQSEYDVELYKQMAAQVGNRKMPLSARMFALSELKRLQGQFESLNKGSPGTSDPARDRINELRKQRGLPPLP